MQSFTSGGGSAANQPHSPFQPSPWASTPTHAAQPGWNDYSSNEQRVQPDPYGQDLNQTGNRFGEAPAGSSSAGGYDSYGQETAEGYRSRAQAQQGYEQDPIQQNGQQRDQPGPRLNAAPQEYARAPATQAQRPPAIQRHSSLLRPQQQARGGKQYMKIGQQDHVDKLYRWQNITSLAQDRHPVSRKALFRALLIFC
jgi:hypothetical protein